MADALRIAAVALLITASTAASGAELDVSEIVRRHIGAIGGRERWQAVQSLVVRGTASFASFTWVWKGPSKMRSEERDTAYTQKTLITAFDGASGWIIDPFKGTPVPRRMSLDELVRWQNGFQIRSDLLDVPSTAHLELLGREKVGQRDAYKLSLHREGRDDVLLWIDAQSYLLVQRARRVAAPWGGEQLAVTPLGDYRNVSGVLIAHSIGPARCSVEVNAAITDQLFEPPR